MIRTTKLFLRNGVVDEMYWIIQQYKFLVGCF